MSKHNTILKDFIKFTNLIKYSFMIYLNICLDYHLKISFKTGLDMTWVSLEQSWMDLRMDKVLIGYYG